MLLCCYFFCFCIRNIIVILERVIEADSVLLRNGVIAEVGYGISAPPGVDVVDGRGGTRLPGLIDCYVHAEPVDLEQALVFGVTTELDMANGPKVVEQLRATAEHRDDVADIRSAFRATSAPGTGLSKVIKDLPTVSGPEDAAAFVAARVAEGADYIKVILDPGGEPYLLSVETVRALVEAAHTRSRHFDINKFNTRFNRDGL